MQIIYAKDQPHLFTQYYEQYIQQYQVALIYHPYLLKYFQLIAAPLYDESFVVIENNACVGICYCPIYQESNGALSISNNGGYTPIPLAQNKRILKAMFHLLDEIAMAHQCSMIKLYLDPQQHLFLYQNELLYHNQDILLLKEFGYIDNSSIDTIINLNLSKEQLWTNLRKSYKPLINSYSKKIEIIQANSNSDDLHHQYVQLHHLCSRRKTRSDASFDIQLSMLHKGFASLFGAKYQDSLIGFCYFFHHNKCITYHSGSDDPSYEGSGIPIYHLILWKAIQHFAELGFLTMDLGLPSNFTTLQGFNDYCDQKQCNIALFKRGMGGIPISLVRGIKYLDKITFQEDIEIFKNQFILD